MVQSLSADPRSLDEDLQVFLHFILSDILPQSLRPQALLKGDILKVRFT
ncbi:Uncharacterised protein [Mycobacteroides abscessus subsp. abscessus]|nr:Uncharacterised protein [Mycobacteroides abscessus subsp. abscessus]